MQVQAVGGVQAVKGAAGVKDSQLDAIRQQIEETKKQIRDLAQDKSIPKEEKQEKQELLQKQLADLQYQLSERQRQIREERMEKTPGTAQAEQPAVGETQKSQGLMDQEAAGRLLKMDGEIRHAERFDRVIISMEGRAHVLESEIEQDGKMNGGALDSKVDELSELQGRIRKAGASFAGDLVELSEKAASGPEEDVSSAKREEEAEAAKEAGEELPTAQKDGKDPENRE